MIRAFLALVLAVSAAAAFGQAFTPNLDGTVGTVAVAASTTNANGTLTPPAAGLFQVRVFNACSTTAFIKFGGTAATTDMPVPAGALEVLTVSAGTTSVGVILATGSGCNVYFTHGRGI
jgi:hypothetical protein